MRRIAVTLCILAATMGWAQNDRAHLLARRANTVHRNVCQGIDTAATCHHTFAEGCSASTRSTYDPYLSFVKNTTPSPRLASNGVKGTFSTLDDFQALDKQAAQQGLGGQEGPNAAALADLGMGNFYTVIGYLYYAMPGGNEACNCQLSKPPDKDFHIGIGFDPALAARIQSGTEKTKSAQNAPKTAAEQTSIVVEMTPHYRAKFHSQWDLPSLENQIGNQVKIVGQLVFDSEHGVPGQDCALAGSNRANTRSCWRASAWEIHPVTEFFVCTKSTACEPNGDGWVKLEDVENL